MRKPMNDVLRAARDSCFSFCHGNSLPVWAAIRGRIVLWEPEV
jgi:hypothetical protein